MMNVLVIGASLKPERYSNKAIKMLKEYNHTVFAIGLREGEVNGVKIQKGFPNLVNIDTLRLFSSFLKRDTIALQLERKTPAS